MESDEVPMELRSGHLLHASKIKKYGDILELGGYTEIECLLETDTTFQQ